MLLTLLSRRTKERAASWPLGDGWVVDLCAPPRNRWKGLNSHLGRALACKGGFLNSSKKPTKRIPHSIQFTCDISLNLIYLMKLIKLETFLFVIHSEDAFKKVKDKGAILTSFWKRGQLCNSVLYKCTLYKTVHCVKSKFANPRILIIGQTDKSGETGILHRFEHFDAKLFNFCFWHFDVKLFYVR